MDYKEAIARAIVACGGWVGPGHGDGGWQRSSGEALHGAGLTELGQRALEEAMWCWGDGGGISAMEEWPDKPVAGNDGGGERCCSCGRCERRRRADSAKWGRG